MLAMPTLPFQQVPSVLSQSDLLISNSLTVHPVYEKQKTGGSNISLSIPLGLGINNNGIFEIF